MPAPTTRHLIQMVHLTAPAAPAAVVSSAPVVPLSLSIEVTTPDGVRFPWAPDRPAGERLQNFSFRTKVGEGFSDASGSLARLTSRDYPDLQLGNTITAVGADGSVAYEGRLEAMPREIGDSHSISVQLAGWMAHAKDRKFTEIYVDRDIGAWGPASRSRKVSLMASNFGVTDPSQMTDPTDNQAGVSTGFQGAWVSPYMPVSEAWYDAGPGVLVAKVAYTWRRQGGVTNLSPWDWRVYSSSDDVAGTTEDSGNLVGLGPAAGTFSPTTARRYAMLSLLYNGTSAGADGAQYEVGWYNLAVYGAHGLLTHIGEPNQPEGVYASDVVKDIATRFCPQLNTRGVEQTSYVIQHLAFKDRTFPFDALLEINKYHLWHLGVWENKTLAFRPYDLTDYVWEVRTDDPGVNVSLQGPSTEGLFNGIVVTYTDVLTGLKNTLTPTSNLDLLDLSWNNPWNQQGYPRWDEIELSTPTLQAQASQIGRAALAERNRPKQPGTIKVSGYIRDRAGNRQPVWKVRAGETVSITNHPNDLPRLIHETSYDDESKTVTISVEAPASALDAVLDRVAAGVEARGV